MSQTPAMSRESRRFIWAIVIAQMLVQIGAFSLPALLPTYIATLEPVENRRWMAGRHFLRGLCGRGTAAGVVHRSCTDRAMSTRSVRASPPLSHLGFALLADGFWSALIFRALAGMGWAGAYMPGLKAIADTLEGNEQSRAVSMHAAGVGIAGASFIRYCRAARRLVQSVSRISVRRHCRTDRTC